MADPTIVARALGADWQVSEAERRLWALHRPSGVRFVAVPGGSFEMGISDADVADGRSLLPWDEGIARAVDRAVARARPLRRVEVRPFLCAERLLSPADCARLGAPRRSDTQKRADALAMAERAGLRLPSEAELEWLARDGRGLAFALDAVRRAADRDDSEDLTSSFGLREVLGAAWAADDWHDHYVGAPSTSAPWSGGDPCGVYRGGPTLRPLDAAELWAALSGLRGRGLEPDEEGVMRVPDCRVRLAFSLPELG